MGRFGLVATVGVMAASSQACLLLSAFARPQVALVAKSNLLIWNPATKTEHLVQSLALLSKANSFDYLIPTPTKPTVSVVGQAGFKEAYNILQSRPLVMDQIQPGVSHRGGDQLPNSEGSETSYFSNVRITTIHASDILALSRWMEKSAYHPNESQRAWLQRYVDRGWFLTAFQVKPTAEFFKTDSVRLSFKTEVPVSPYYSAGINWLNSVRQELYLISPKPLVGYVGNKAVWKGNVTSHGYLAKAASDRLAKELKLSSDDIPSQSWMDWYVESGKIGDTVDDLYFVKPPALKPTKGEKVAQAKKKSLSR